MDRYICIHGHFYQPPRENPWLEAIESQDSAYPYHDWNERITAECYAPNAASRILGERDRIARIVNNYGRISFNFGPTLLAWLELYAPDVYEAILRADRRSAERFGGHGSAIAQAYNHMILPLANERDRVTQVRWGIRDFEKRFGRRPEGMWLPETAADIASLEALAAEGIRYTILAPSQAARVRPLDGANGNSATTQAEPGGDAEADAEAESGDEGEDGWIDVSGSRIDSTRPYLQKLPSGREIALFFYDGPISRAVAFEKLLSSGERFAHRITHAFDEGTERPQLAHIATDGETYGHHHSHGEMALAWALQHIRHSDLGRLTNYGEYLELHPPEYEVQILENTSWSCAHGVERWRSDCGCNSGGRSDWNQLWREPLRSALDWLRDELTPRYEAAARELFADAWAARDDYIDVILERSDETRRAFLAQHAAHELDEAETVRAWKLLEMQRHAMLMYTSCGWFFDELSGIETTQVVQYAARAVQLANELFEEDIETGFLERLERAPSNLPDVENGRGVYERFVLPARVTLDQVAAHFAVSSLFEEYQNPARVYCYTIDALDRRTGEAGRARLSLGHGIVRSELTGEKQHLSFGAVRVVDHTVGGGVTVFTDDASYAKVADQVVNTFRNADFAHALRLMEKYFQAELYSLRSLFRDEQRRVLEKAMETPLAQAESSYRQIYERNAPLMRFLRGLNLPQPREFRTAAELVINADVRREASSDELSVDRMLSLLGEAADSEVALDREGIGYALSHTMERTMQRFADAPSEVGRLERMDQLTELLATVPFEVNVWTVQNLYWGMMRSLLPERRRQAQAGDAEAQAWVDVFLRLGERLQILVVEDEQAEREPAAAAAE